MYRFIFTVALLLGVAPEIAGQQDQDVIRNFDSRHLEAFLEDELLLEENKIPASAGFSKKWFQENGISYVQFLTPASYPNFLVYEGKEKRIVLEYPVPRDSLDDEKIAKFASAWKALGFSTVIRSDKTYIYLRGSIGYGVGLSMVQLRRYYSRFMRERSEFLVELEKLRKATKKQVPVPNDEELVRAQLVKLQGDPEPKAQANIVRLGFPARTAADPADLANSRTGWEIEWDLSSKDNNASNKDPGSVLRIVRATFFWKDLKNEARSVTVVRNLWLAEAFTPYDDTQTTFFDIAWPFRFKTLKADENFKGPNCVLPGEILRSANPHFDKMVYKEVHDDGLRWTSGSDRNEPNQAAKIKAYRGEKLMLWALFKAGNYVYIVEYDFTDDGRIICRLGFTGHNFYARGFGKDKLGAKGKGEKTPGGDVHLHIGCWRMDFDLGDPTKNDYLLISRRLDPKGDRFRVVEAPFNNGREGKAKWEAEEFTSLRAVSGTTKSLGGQRPIAFDLIPVRLGSARKLFPTHQAKQLNVNMDFVNYDFWITHSPLDQKAYHEVPRLASQQRELKGESSTVWYNTPALHVPRGEDFGPDGRSARDGVAVTTFIEFTLRPRDLFDSTPFYR